MALYSTSNKINITEVDGTSFKGRYAADGSWNGVNKTGVTSYVGLINQCGAINYSINNSSSPVPLYATNGSLNLTDQGLLNGALSVSINAINALSLASTMLAFESNGLAIDFTDSAFLSSTGFYGSARIKDLTTPDNEYNSSPTNTASSLLTYSSPSPKMTMGPSGTYRYGPHNLYVNSASPANQSITVVSGADYTVVITGSVSVTASGAATGTWTVGTTNFTAATGTLTLGSTSGAGTVHVRRTNSDTTYLQTGASARYGLPYEWNSSAVLQGVLVEEARTNLFLNNRVPVTQTCTVTNAASYTVSFFGTGSITFSGANSSTLNGTGASNRVATTFTTTSTSLTCTVSGSIDLVQVEIGAFATSPIETFGATVTRAADNISLATTAFPISASAVTLMAKFKDATVPSGQYSFMLHYGTNGNNRAGMAVKGNGAVNCFAATAGSFFYDNDGNNDFSGTLTGSSTHKVAMRVTTNDFRAAADGSLGTLDSVGTYSLSPTTLGIGAYTVGGSGQYSKHMQSVLVVPRAYVDAELQTLTT